MATKADSPAAYVVLDTFVVADGLGSVVYERGEVHAPDDPALKRWPAKFGPIAFTRHEHRAKAAPKAEPEPGAE